MYVRMQREHADQFELETAVGTSRAATIAGFKGKKKASSKGSEGKTGEKKEKGRVGKERAAEDTSEATRIQPEVSLPEVTHTHTRALSSHVLCHFILNLCYAIYMYMYMYIHCTESLPHVQYVMM